VAGKAQTVDGIAEATEMLPEESHVAGRSRGSVNEKASIVGVGTIQDEGLIRTADDRRNDWHGVLLEKA
jgi:hypothetical protein